MVHVDAVAIVDETVAVVVDAVGVAIGRVVEHVGRQVRMGVVDSGVDHRHHHVAAPGGEAPRPGGVDVSAGRPARLAGVLETPERAEERVVQDGHRLHDIVGFRIEDIEVAPVMLDGLLRADSLRELDQLETRDRRVPRHRACAEAPVGGALHRRRDAGREPDEDLVGDVLRGGAAGALATSTFAGAAVRSSVSGSVLKLGPSAAVAAIVTGLESVLQTRRKTFESDNG